jgi:hypothetical protein
MVLHRIPYTTKAAGSSRRPLSPATVCLTEAIPSTSRGNSAAIPRPGYGHWLAWRSNRGSRPRTRRCPDRTSSVCSDDCFAPGHSSPSSRAHQLGPVIEPVSRREKASPVPSMPTRSGPPVNFFFQPIRLRAAIRVSSSSGVAAATGVRRGPWVRTTRSRPCISATWAPASWQTRRAPR